MTSMNNRRRLSVSRRQIIQSGGALTVGALAGSIGFPAVAQGKAFKLGYVSPQTGPLAAFGEADSFVISGVRELFKNGVSIGGKSVPVQLVEVDIELEVTARVRMG